MTGIAGCWYNRDKCGEEGIFMVQAVVLLSGSVASHSSGFGVLLGIGRVWFSYWRVSSPASTRFDFKKKIFPYVILSALHAL